MFKLSFFLAALLLVISSPAVADDFRMRVIASEFVLSGKFSKLESMARQEGIRLDAIYAGSEEGTPEEWLKGIDLLLLDTPRPNDRASVTEKLGDVLKKDDAPLWVQIGGGPPAFGGIPPQHARMLVSYYGNGGEENMRRFFTYLRLWREGGDVSSVPPPISLPKQGFYHPDASTAFSSFEEYMGWGQERWEEDAPRLAMAIHEGYLSSMQTGPIDEIVRAAEKRGVMPIAFWFVGRDEQGVQNMIGQAKPDLLINLTHMQNGAARQAEFEALDVPVMQGLSARTHTRDEWRAATSGVSMHMVAPFLSVTETWGMSDALVLDAVEEGEPVALSEQVELLIGKAIATHALRNVPVAEKRLALMFWNYPPGEKNFSASHLNVPKSLEVLTAALAENGYAVPAVEEQMIIAAGQKLLGGIYRPETLTELLKEDLAEALPLETYESWLASLPSFIGEEVNDRWGSVKESRNLHEVDGKLYFIIPRLNLGNLTIMPQPPRAGEIGQAYHDGKEPPSHAYLATYLYVRESMKAHALIHFGTHGTQEWTPGKDRGLWAYDYPFLTLGDMPVFYPYIQDNIAEAIQAKRRGRAVVISHQTPAFAPAGLYDEMRDLHDLIHQYEQLMEGAVKEETATRITDMALASGLAADMEWKRETVEKDFPSFMRDLHDHLHVVAASSMPLGLHSFGKSATPSHRLSTILQQLGPDFYLKLDIDPAEAFTMEWEQIETSPAFTFLSAYLRDEKSLDTIEDAELRAMVEKAIELDHHQAKVDEIPALLKGLGGGFVLPGSGGDPVRNPDVPNGRNLYAFEANKIPTRAAYETGGEALADLVSTFQQENGRMPEKLAFSLWSSESLRHLGVMEAQVLHAMGLRPVWDEGGRVVALDIIPAKELGRPRIDAVLQVTSVYRDQFDHFMRLLGEAIERLSQLDEKDNAVAENTKRISAELTEKGIAAAEADQLAMLRIFSNEPGDYGSGLPGQVLASAEWDDDTPLAESFLSRMRHAYGSSYWGHSVETENLLAKQLSGSDAAILSRSSNLHGVLSTDHPFEYLGGLALAIRHLDGKSPALYISDLRKREPRLTTAARFLSEEMRSRYLNPQWIEGMKAEGYAGTLEMLNAVNNLWGWQVTAPETVRADQWQQIHDTYVADNRGLELTEWFEANNAAAQAQLVERLIEAIRKGYWDADEETRRGLAERWQALQQRDDVPRTAEKIHEYADSMVAGFGLSGNAGADAASSGASSVPVQGQVMEQVEPAEQAEPEDMWRFWFALILILVFFASGAARQFRAGRVSYRSSLNE